MKGLPGIILGLGVIAGVVFIAGKAWKASGN